MKIAECVANDYRASRKIERRRLEQPLAEHKGAAYGIAARGSIGYRSDGHCGDRPVPLGADWLRPALIFSQPGPERNALAEIVSLSKDPLVVLCFMR